MFQVVEANRAPVQLELARVYATTFDVSRVWTWDGSPKTTPDDQAALRVLSRSFVQFLYERDVDEGREALNFSEWQRIYKDAGESAQTVNEGEMPLQTYVLVHPSARLSLAERRALAEGLAATLGTDHE